jgi:hypothetical protein
VRDGPAESLAGWTVDACWVCCPRPMRGSTISCRAVQLQRCQSPLPDCYLRYLRCTSYDAGPSSAPSSLPDPPQIAGTEWRKSEVNSAIPFLHAYWPATSLLSYLILLVPADSIKING